MKDLILYPPILGAVLIGLAASFIILFYLTKDKVITSIFEKLAVYIFLFVVSGVTTFPFSHLDLASLGTHEKTLFSAIFLLLVYAAIFILLRVRISQILSNIIILFQQKYLSIYLGLTFFSACWSATPWLTLRAAISLILISSFAVYFAKKYNWRQILELLRWNQTFVAIFSVYLSIFVPSEGQIEKGWAGAIGHPINLGNMMALTATLWLLNAIHNPKYLKRSLLFCVLSITVMQLANSAGAFIVFLSLIVIVFIPPIFRRLTFLQANFLFTFILSVFTIPSIWLFSNFSNTMSLLDKDVTFTGRVPLWNLLIEKIVRERLWLGYGYSGFWQPWQGSDNPAAQVFRLIGDWAVHAHNGFLDIFLSVGLIGLTLFTLSFLGNINRAMRLIFSNRSPESALPLIILTFVFVSNLSQTSIISPGYTWFLYVITTVGLQIVSKKKERYLSWS
ncbi:MAG TPA: O-antigen ligase family protein [Coleofasciculaceae cyanobacterium]|jgi:O-antigen ligase